MLVAENISCVRGMRKIFGSLSFSLNPKELLYLQGTNGSGKTSLLRILSGLALAETGQIMWKGTKIQDIREEYASMMLYLGHHPAIKDDFSVIENLNLAIQLAGYKPDITQLNNALEALGLNKHVHLPARVLSQGQKRRLALCRLWLEPHKKLWILDEPYTSLDVSACKILDVKISTYLDAGGMVLMTSHQVPGIKAMYIRQIGLSG